MSVTREQLDKIKFLREAFNIASESTRPASLAANGAPPQGKGGGDGRRSVAQVWDRHVQKAIKEADALIRKVGATPSRSANLLGGTAAAVAKLKQALLDEEHRRGQLLFAMASEGDVATAFQREQAACTALDATHEDAMAAMAQERTRRGSAVASMLEQHNDTLDLLTTESSGLETYLPHHSDAYTDQLAQCVQRLLDQQANTEKLLDAGAPLAFDQQHQAWSNEFAQALGTLKSIQDAVVKDKQDERSRRQEILKPVSLRSTSVFNQADTLKELLDARARQDPSLAPSAQNLARAREAASDALRAARQTLDFPHTARAFEDASTKANELLSALTKARQSIEAKLPGNRDGEQLALAREKFVLRQLDAAQRIFSELKALCGEDPYAFLTPYPGAAALFSLASGESGTQVFKEERDKVGAIMKEQGSFDTKSEKLQSLSETWGDIVPAASDELMQIKAKQQQLQAEVNVNSEPVRKVQGSIIFRASECQPKVVAGWIEEKMTCANAQRLAKEVCADNGGGASSKTVAGETLMHASDGSQKAKAQCGSVFWICHSNDDDVREIVAIGAHTEESAASYRIEWPSDTSHLPMITIKNTQKGSESEKRRLVLG